MNIIPFFKNLWAKIPKFCQAKTDILKDSVCILLTNFGAIRLINE